MSSKNLEGLIGDLQGRTNDLVARLDPLRARSQPQGLAPLKNLTQTDFAHVIVRTGTLLEAVLAEVYLRELPGASSKTQIPALNDLIGALISLPDLLPMDLSAGLERFRRTYERAVSQPPDGFAETDVIQGP